MEASKYHQPDNCGPAGHYLDQHRQAMLLSLPTKTEVRRTLILLLFSREICTPVSRVSGFIPLSGKK